MSLAGASSTAVWFITSFENTCTPAIRLGRHNVPGTHEPLVTRECWQRVQELLDARAKNKIRKMKHDFAYSGLVPCGHCGCLLVGELKKGKYVYGRGLWCLLISSH